jgi:hypothetical protein
LAAIATRIEQAAKSAAQSAQVIDTAEYGPVIQQVDDGRHWLYFRWGLGVGTTVVLAIVIFVALYVNKGA